MKIAIAGGTGQAGSQAARVAQQRGHDVVILARSQGVDLRTGKNVHAALEGVDVVIDASGAGQGENPVEFHEAVIRHLVKEQPPHIVALSIVNCDRATDFPLYAGKLAQEQALKDSGVPYTIARSTQFHEFAAQVWKIGKVGPVHFAPRMRTQPVAVQEVGEHLVDLAQADPAGTVPDFAGPKEESLVDMVLSYGQATGRRGFVLPISMRGVFGKMQRSGGLLPNAGAKLGSLTFEQWLEQLQ